MVSKATKHSSSSSSSLSCQPLSGCVRAWFWTDATCTLCSGIQEGQAMMGSTSPSPILHDLPPPLQPTCPQRPAAGGSENAAVGQCVRATGGGGGVVLEEAALGERLIGRLIRQWKSEARSRRVGRPVSFCCYCGHLLTFRSLCTIPFMWQWFTLSRICCMQWLWRRERPGQKQKGEEEGNR